MIEPSRLHTGLIYDDRFLEHDTGRGHPERPARLRAIVDHLKSSGLWRRLVSLPFHECDMNWIRTLHDQHYIERVQEACGLGAHYIDEPDSAICPESFDVARLAVGGVLAALDAVMTRQVRNAFCVIRPPGHHAERNRSMGFCLFNNVAIGAEYLLRKHQLQRVAIVDFDVHHGNGTQHSFEDRHDVLFVSIHEDPAYQYPGTGHECEVGNGRGEGHTLNLPMPPHCGDAEYQRAFTERILPALRQFQPEFLLASAGFDASDRDPLGHQLVSTTGFEWIARRLREVAEEQCQGRFVAMLEGGYDLAALSEGVAAFVRVLLEETGPGEQGS